MVYKEIIEEELIRLKEDIIKASKAEDQEASGNTYEEIEVENLTEFSGQLVGPPHIGVLATGRKAGKTPKEFDDIIAKWAETKGLEYDTQEEFEKMVKAIAWSIRLKGTELHKEQQGGQLPQIFEVPINECIDRITKRIAIASSNSVIERIDNEIKKFYGS